MKGVIADMPETIYLIRHGEKPDPAQLTTGVTIDGAADSHSLTPHGWQRSGALAVLFTHPPRPDGVPLTTPDRLLSPDYGDPAGTVTHRPYQTLLGLSAATGRGIESPFPEGQEAALAAAVLAGGPGTVLVCWEHHRIPAIAAAIPVTSDAAVPGTWPDDRFDLIWQFTLADPATRRYAFRQLAQNVLGGASVP